MSAAQIGELSGALAAKAGVDDGQIQAGANLLLTFKNVKKEGEGLNDVFKRATIAGLDLAAAGFGSVEGNALQLGKALNDPIKGISALSRSGVTFTEVQKEQIKGFVASNDLLAAQKIILGEVEAQVGGTAAATATAGEKAAYAYGELKESIGTALLPVIDRLQTAFVKLAPTIQAAIDGIGPAFQRAVAFVRPFAEAVGGQLVRNFNALKAVFDFLQPTFDRIGDFFRKNPAVVKAFAITLVGLVGAIGAVTLATTLFSVALNSTGIPLVIIGIAALAAGLVYAYQTSEGFRTAVNNFATTMQTVVLPALQSLWAYFQANIIPVFVAVGAVIRDQVLPIIGRFAQFVVGTLVPAIVRIATQIGSNLAPIFKQLVATFKSDVLPALQLLLAKFKEYQPAIQAVIAVVVKVVGKFLEFAAAVLGKVLPPLIRFAGFLIGTVVPSIAATIGVGERIIQNAIAIGRAFVDAVKDVGKFVSGLKDKIGDAIANVKLLLPRAVAALSGAATALLQAGKDLIQGLINGIVSKASDAVGAIGDAVGNMIGAAKDKLKIFSPSRVFREIGQFTMVGLAKGVVDDEGKPTKAVKAAMDKLLSALEEKRGTVQGLLDGFKSDFASLRDSIASTFTGNLFEATSAQDLFSNLLGKKADLSKLKAAFTKLRGYGLDPAFLSQLFASGNGALILDLAAGPRDQAGLAQSLFNDTTALGASLGTQVAKADIGPDIRRQTAVLEDIRQDIKTLHKRIGKELNTAASNGARGRVA